MKNDTPAPHNDTAEMLQKVDGMLKDLRSMLEMLKAAGVEYSGNSSNYGVDSPRPLTYSLLTDRHKILLSEYREIYDSLCSVDYIVYMLGENTRLYMEYSLIPDLRSNRFSLKILYCYIQFPQHRPVEQAINSMLAQCKDVQEKILYLYHEDREQTLAMKAKRVRAHAHNIIEAISNDLGYSEDTILEFLFDDEGRLHRL